MMCNRFAAKMRGPRSVASRPFAQPFQSLLAEPVASLTFRTFQPAEFVGQGLGLGRLRGTRAGRLPDRIGSLLENRTGGTFAA